MCSTPSSTLSWTLFVHVPRCDSDYLHLPPLCMCGCGNRTTYLANACMHDCAPQVEAHLMADGQTWAGCSCATSGRPPLRGAALMCRSGALLSKSSGALAWLQHLCSSFGSAREFSASLHAAVHRLRVSLRSSAANLGSDIRRSNLGSDIRAANPTRSGRSSWGVTGALHDGCIL
eukprot:365950-Chlamydomonas_euryale.AAC.3